MLHTLVRHWPRKLVDTSRVLFTTGFSKFNLGTVGFGNTCDGHESSAKFSTGIPTGESIEVIRARVFDTHIGNNLRSGRKILRKKPIGDVLMNWYYPNPLKDDPLLIDTDAER
jgi:Mitochondrial ribosomal subunit S27